MEKSKLKTSSQEVFPSSVDVNLLITSLFFIVEICDDLQPTELKKDFAIMKRMANQPEKLTEDEIFYAKKCMKKWDKIFKRFQRKISNYRTITEIFRWYEERNRNKIKEDNEVR